MKENEKLFDHKPSEEELLNLIPDVVDEEDDPNNPKSLKYQRKLDYPKIKWVSVVLNIIGFIVVVTALVILLWYLTSNIYITIFVPLGSTLLYCLIRLSSIIIFLVECYQKFAPTKIRMRCRFEPSCSQYMILAVKKYGAFKGLFKGLNRISRCHYPNGGYDEP